MAARDRAETAEPVRLSIVIAAWNGEESLRRCLDSLLSETDPPEREIVVASNFNTDQLEATMPAGVRTTFLPLAADSTVPVLRARGIERSRGEIVALLEDHGVVGDRWSAEILKGHDSHAVVGGAVENSSTASLSWAMYFYDYGNYMLPGMAGPAESLSGINVSYSRAALEDLRDRFRSGFYESVIHRELQRLGYTFYFRPSAVVYHNKDYRLREAVRGCYHHGRLFAAQRAGEARQYVRLVRTFGSFLLPLLLSTRVVRRTLRKGRLRRELFICLPYLCLLVAAWSSGESWGYLNGPGKSAAEWR